MTEINICLTCQAPPPALAAFGPVVRCGSIARHIDAPTAPAIPIVAAVPSAPRFVSSKMPGGAGMEHR